MSFVSSSCVNLRCSQSGAPGLRGRCPRVSECCGRRSRLQSFKRVNSIDQFAAVNGRRVGLETLRSEVLPTRSSAVGAEWTEVTLLGLDREPRCALACGAPAIFGADVVFSNGGYDRVFEIGGQTAAGGEAIDIVPSRAMP